MGFESKFEDEMKIREGVRGFVYGGLGEESVGVGRVLCLLLTGPNGVKWASIWVTCRSSSLLIGAGQNCCVPQNATQKLVPLTV